MVRDVKSVINYIKPDRIDPDGTLYYFPFKVVPLINIIKASHRTSGGEGHDPTLPLNYVWRSDVNPGIVTFQILSEPDDEYLPVGDLAFMAPQDPDARDWWQNDYLKPILDQTPADILNAKVLFVKNDERYCKVLKDSDFMRTGDDDGSGIYYNLVTYGVTSLNSTTSPQQIGEYVVLCDLVSRNGSSPQLNQKISNGYDQKKIYTKVRKVVAVNKNYIVDLTGYTWESSSIGTGNWSGLDDAGNVQYSSPFINTFFTNAGRSGALIFYDIVPETVARTCCSNTQQLSLQPYCKFLTRSDKGTRCQAMMNTFCDSKQLETPECREWCGSNGVYCDEKILDYCKNVDLKKLELSDESGGLIKPDSYNYYNIDNYNVEPTIASLIKVAPSTTCKNECDNTYECDAYTNNSSECALYKTNKLNLLNIEASLIYSNGTNTFLKNRESETLTKVQKNLCSCFKDDEYYKNYIQTIASKYPEDVQNMLLLSTSSRDKRCFYPECTGGYSLQHKNFRVNDSPCGDNNIQICFQNIQTSGSSLQDSSIDNTQVNNCRIQVQSSTDDTEGTSIQSIKKYTCDSTNYACVESEFGTYDTISDCETNCKKPAPKPNPKSSSKDSKLSTTAWIGIAVAIIIMITIITFVLMSM